MTKVKNFGIFALILFACSCNKQLNIMPTDQIDGSVVFNNISDLNKGVLGVYADMNEEYFLQLGSIPADECRIGPANNGANGNAQSLFDWAESSGDLTVTNPWSNAYQAIYQANKVLAAIDKVPVSSSGDSIQKAYLKAELLGIRAFEHFQLYRAYAYSPMYNAGALAVPYVTNTDINAKPSRPTSTVFFNSLVQDVKSAAAVLGNSANNPVSGDNTRLSGLALMALQARIALYCTNWLLADSMATLVINNAPLATIEQFPQIWEGQSNAEMIFKLKRTNQSTVRPGDVFYNVPFGLVYFAPSQKLLQLYDTVNDVRYASYFATYDSLTQSGELPWVVKKYAGSAGAQNIADVPVFRTAEMYLIRAEALMKLGNVAGAGNDINTLRAARINSYKKKTFDAASIQDAIMSERYKELAYEGHRFYDLRRTGLNVVRNTSDLPSGFTNTTLAPGDMYYYIPIPQAEVLANPNINPNNPGW